MSALCHKRTHAPLQIQGIFDGYAVRSTHSSNSLRSVPKSIGLVRSVSAPFSSTWRLVSHVQSRSASPFRNDAVLARTPRGPPGHLRGCRRLFDHRPAQQQAWRRPPNKSRGQRQLVEMSVGSSRPSQPCSTRLGNDSSPEETYQRQINQDRIGGWRPYVWAARLVEAVLVHNPDYVCDYVYCSASC